MRSVRQQQRFETCTYGDTCAPPLIINNMKRASFHSNNLKNTSPSFISQIGHGGTVSRVIEGQTQLENYSTLPPSSPRRNKRW